MHARSGSNNTTVVELDCGRGVVKFSSNVLRKVETIGGFLHFSTGRGGCAGAGLYFSILPPVGDAYKIILDRPSVRISFSYALLDSVSSATLDFGASLKHPDFGGFASRSPIGVRAAAPLGSRRILPNPHLGV